MLNCIFKSLVAWQNSLEILQEQTLLKYSSLAASSSGWVQTWSEETRVRLSELLSSSGFYFILERNKGQ